MGECVYFCTNYVGVIGGLTAVILLAIGVFGAICLWASK